MQVDFYQLSRDPIDLVVPVLAAKAVESGARVLVVCREAEARARMSEALWAREKAFLAHGEADSPHAGRQPILFAGDAVKTNEATIAIVADGEWRDAVFEFDRAILLFGAERTGEARTLWSTLSGSGHALRIFKQREDGSWREGR